MLTKTELNLVQIGIYFENLRQKAARSLQKKLVGTLREVKYQIILCIGKRSAANKRVEHLIRKHAAPA